MDDPWGSLWAQTNDDNKNAHNTGLGSLGLEPPPKVVLSVNNNGSVNNSQVSLASPWEKDDGFGDWTGTELGSLTPSSLNPWTSWGDTNQQQPSPQRGRSTTKDSLSAWPSSTASSPLRPLPHIRTSVSRSPTLSRQPSFDPWKSDLSLKAPDDVFAPTTPTQPRSRNEPSNFDMAPRSPAEQDQLDEGSQKQKQADWENSEDAKSIKNSKQQRKLEVPKKQSNIEQAHFRPSSRSSNSSAREEDPGDSPITSVGGDEMTVTGDTKSASKVQELVDMFNGLSKHPDTVEDTVDRSPHQSEQEDFEKAARQKGDTLFRPDSPSSAPQSFTQKEVFSSGWDAEPDPDWEAVRLQKDRVPVYIPMDKINELFPAEDESLCRNKHKRQESFSRDIHDLFTEDSERKAWYRISRFGSMLRNDAPDFENYFSVAWENTKVYEEILIVVKRWMQDTSLISGGGGLNGTTRPGRIGGFGWDSAGPIVSMEDIFGSRRQKLHCQDEPSSLENHVAVQPQNIAVTPNAEVDAPTSMLPLSPSTAAFSWNSMAQPYHEKMDQKQPHSALQRPLPLHQQRNIHQKQASSTWKSAFSLPISQTPTNEIFPAIFESVIPQQATSSSNSPKISIPTPTSIPTLNPAPPIPSTDGCVNDEEWGEMVSSSTIIPEPAIPLVSLPLMERLPMQLTPSLVHPKISSLDQFDTAKSVLTTALPTASDIVTKAHSQDTTATKSPAAAAVPEKLSEQEEKLIQDIIAGLPDLSWMIAQKKQAR